MLATTLFAFTATKGLASRPLSLTRLTAASTRSSVSSTLRRNTGRSRIFFL